MPTPQELYRVPGVKNAYRQELIFQQQQEDRARQIAMQQAEEERAAQAAQIAQQRAQQEQQLFPTQLQSAQTAAQKAQTELATEDLMRTATSDINAWVGTTDPTGQRPYAVGYDKLPQEAQQHFVSAYPTIPTQVIAKGINDATRSATGNAMAGVPQFQSDFPIERTVVSDDKGGTQVTQSEKAPQVRQLANVPDTAIAKLTTAQKAYNKIAPLREVYNQVKDSFLTGQGWAAVPVPIKKKLEALFGQKEYQKYDALMNDIIIDIAKGLGGDSGVLSDQDIQRWKEALPSVNQNPEVAQQLFDKVENDIRNQYNLIHDMYGRVYYMGSIPQLSGGPNKLPANQPVEQPAVQPAGVRAPIRPTGPLPIPPTRPAVGVRPTSPAPAAQTPTAPAQSGTMRPQKVDKLSTDLPPGYYEYKGKVYKWEGQPKK